MYRSGKDVWPFTVVTPAGASLTMYREIRSYANSIWDDNNNNNNNLIVNVANNEPSHGVLVISFNDTFFSGAS